MRFRRAAGGGRLTSAAGGSAPRRAPVARATARVRVRRWVRARRCARATTRPSCAFFLESGGPGRCIEGLGTREALWSADVPEDAAAEEAKARRPRRRGDAAFREGRSEQGTAPRSAPARATRRRAGGGRAVIARIQREAKSGRGVGLPPRRHARGDPGDARRGRRARALRACVGRASARSVPDARRRGSSRSARSRRSRPRARRSTLGDPDVRPVRGARRARGARGRAARACRTATKRVLVSPAGPLGYVPFAALSPSVTVAYVPSGTTYGCCSRSAASGARASWRSATRTTQTKVGRRRRSRSRGAARRLARCRRRARRRRRSATGDAARGRGDRGGPARRAREASRAGARSTSPATGSWTRSGPRSRRWR